MSDKSPLSPSCQGYSVRSPSITNKNRNFSFHSQQLGSILNNQSLRKNAGSGLSFNSKSVISDSVDTVEDGKEEDFDLMNLDLINLPNYDSPKCSTK